MSNARRGAEYCKRGLVNFVTNPKVIQAFLTGGAFAILSLISGVLAVRIAPSIPPLDLWVVVVRIRPVDVKFVFIILITAFWYWADRNTERFQNTVEDVSGTDVDEENKQMADEDTTETNG